MPTRKRARRKRGKASPGQGHIYQRGAIWWVKIHLGAGRKPVVRSSKDPAKGRDGTMQEHAQKLLAELQGEKIRGEITGTDADRVTCGELLDDYLAYYQEDGKASYENVKYKVEASLRPYWGNRKARTVTTEDTRQYRAHRKAQGVDDPTVNRELAYLRAAFNRGRKNCTPPRVANVPHFHMVKENNIRQGFLPDDLHAKLRDHLPADVRPLYVTAYWTGIRRGELLKVRWPQVDLDGRMMTLQTNETKNNAAREIPILAEMHVYLSEARQWLIDHGYPQFPWVFFWRHAGGPKQIRSFRHSFEQAVENLKVKTRSGAHLTFHDLRRTSVRNMRRAGVPKEVRMAVAGHKTESMHRRYGIVDHEDVAVARNAMDTFFGSA